MFHDPDKANRVKANPLSFLNLEVFDNIFSFKMVLLSCCLGMAIFLGDDLYPESIKILWSLLLHFLGTYIYFIYLCLCVLENGGGGGVCEKCLCQ